jgi:membrane protein implicated in regulation of membrane protease activity
VTRLILAAVFLLVTLVSASAYVDPGTGSMIIQVVIAAVVGAGAFLGAFWRKLFRRRRDPDDESVAGSKSDD